jgi:predicted RNase H-like HicB family nuclease
MAATIKRHGRLTQKTFEVKTSKVFFVRVIIARREEPPMEFTIEHEQEEDGRWLAEIIELPGVMQYGDSPEEAIAKAEALALRVIADRIEHGEKILSPLNITFASA